MLIKALPAFCSTGENFCLGESLSSKFYPNGFLLHETLLTFEENRYAQSWRKVFDGASRLTGESLSRYALKGKGPAVFTRVAAFFRFFLSFFMTQIGEAASCTNQRSNCAPTRTDPCMGKERSLTVFPTLSPVRTGTACSTALSTLSWRFERDSAILQSSSTKASRVVE